MATNIRPDDDDDVDEALADLLRQLTVICARRAKRDGLAPASFEPIDTVLTMLAERMTGDLIERASVHECN